MKKHLFIISTSLLLFSCQTRTAVNKTPETTPVDTKAPVANTAFFETVTKKSAFNQVKINSNINVENGSFVPAISATIYIENSKKVWMNFAAAFLNVARGIATPDGIKGYEKLSKNYIDSDYTYLNKKLNVNFINYQSLQNLLVGKTFLPINEKEFTLTNNAQGYVLSSTKNQKVVVDGKTEEYKITLNYSKAFDLVKVNLQDTNSTDTFEVNYSNWVNFGTERFPQNVKIIIKGAKNSQILIENTKFDFLKMETPYSVPSNYTKKEIR